MHRPTRSKNRPETVHPCWRLLLLAAALPARGGARAEVILAPNVRILEAEEVRRDHVRERDGKLWLEIPGHAAWVLEASPREPVHPIPATEVADAWLAVHPAFRDLLAVTFIILPLPREVLPITSAEDGLVYLSPATLVPYSKRQVHFLVAHEMGHCLHRALLGEDPSAWQEYRHRRGMVDDQVFNDAASHPNRPREIFAEDFRFLFGGGDANYSGTIENPSLALPDAVPGLRGYFFGLGDRLRPTAKVSSAPAPSGMGAG